MCDIVLGTAIGVGAASAGVNQYAQTQAANEQNRYRAQLGISQNQRYKENAEAVIKDIGLQTDQLVRREIEQGAAIRQELENYTRNARMSAATTRTMAAAAGVEGRSVDLLHQQFARDVAEAESAAQRNFKSYRAQTNMEIQAVYARGQSAINNGYPNPLPPVATVNPLTNIMNGITTGIGVYGAMSSFRAPSLAANANPSTANIPNFTQTPFGQMPGKFTFTQTYSPIRPF